VRGGEQLGVTAQLDVPGDIPVEAEPGGRETDHPHRDRHRGPGRNPGILLHHGQEYVQSTSPSAVGKKGRCHPLSSGAPKRGNATARTVTLLDATCQSVGIRRWRERLTLFSY